MPRIPARHALLLRTVRASVSLPFLRRPLSPLAVHLVAPAPFVVGERLRGAHAVRPVGLPQRGVVGPRAAGHGSVRTCRAPRVVAGPRGRRMEEIPGRRARAPPGTRRSRRGGIGGWAPMGWIRAGRPPSSHQRAAASGCLCHSPTAEPSLSRSGTADAGRLSGSRAVASWTARAAVRTWCTVTA
jgi:hypothetical protein